MGCVYHFSYFLFLIISLQAPLLTLSINSQGVTCVDGKVQILDLSGCSLEGTLASELSQLSELRSLILCKNRFSGVIPKEYVSFSKLEVLDLRDNDLSGEVPPELSNDLSPKHLLVLEDLNLIHVGVLEETDISRRRELLEETSNLAAETAPPAPSPSPGIITEAISRSSGSFPAVTNAKKRIPPLVPPPNEETSSVLPKNHPEDDKHSKGSKHVWLYVVIAVASFIGLLVLVAVIFFCRKRAVKSIGPWKTGLSGQLQKAFITGVPKLNRSELEIACEDFSNIVETFDGFTVYKGTLSSGVEIAVASTAISESKEWTKAMESAYRRKIDKLSRINHKNFVNLIGYCEEDEPFNRMMVFEYAPNRTIFEHLHDKEMEHLDWSARMRIIMGTAYCLQHMHEMNPPMAHSDFNSSGILLTDDYAAKVLEIAFNLEARLNPKKHASGDLEQASLLLPPEPETNVHSFGVLMLEMISGKLAYSDEYGSIEQWASKYLETNDLKEMIDPTLNTFKEEELEVICDVIRKCLKQEQGQRPSMKEVAEQLKQVLNITPEKATPRSSPLWWAELEILSSEAT
ncbi:unnamed protein product [Cochlearia groenlandica]